MLPVTPRGKKSPSPRGAAKILSIVHKAHPFNPDGGSTAAPESGSAPPDARSVNSSPAAACPHAPHPTPNAVPPGVARRRVVRSGGDDRPRERGWLRRHVPRPRPHARGRRIPRQRAVRIDRGAVRSGRARAKVRAVSPPPRTGCARPVAGLRRQLRLVAHADGHDTRMLLVHGALNEKTGRYRLETRTSLTPIAHGGDTRHTLQLRSMEPDVYRWDTNVDMGVGPISAAEVSNLCVALFRAPEGRTEAQVRDDYRAAFPRTSAVFGRGFAIDSLHVAPAPGGGTSVSHHRRLPPGDDARVVPGARELSREVSRSGEVPLHARRQGRSAAARRGRDATGS